MCVRRQWGIKRLAILLGALLILGAACAGLALSRAAVRAEVETVASDSPVPGTVAMILPPHLTPEPKPTTDPIATPEPVVRSAVEAEIEQELAEDPDADGAEELFNPYANEGMQVQPLFQRNYRDAVVRVGGRARTVASSGCGAVCVSMVASYLTGDARQTPETLFLRAVQMGEYTGSGLKHETLSALLDECGVRNEWIPNTVEGIEQALREGKPVIAHVGPGTFTRNGHYVLLRGFSGDGRVLVNDPASPERSVEAYPIEIFVRQARREDCFLVCWMDSKELKITNMTAVSVDDAEAAAPVPAIMAAALKGAW